VTTSLTGEKTADRTASIDAARASDRWIASRLCWGLVIAASVIAFVLIAHNARTGAVEDRIRNEGVQGAPRTYPPAIDVGLDAIQIGTIVLIVVMFVVCFVAWKRYPKHPYLLMMIVTTAIVWQDPIMNWAPYAVYNPQLWHFPENWPLVNISPTVEPFIVLGYAAFYFLPFFPALWILRRFQRSRNSDSFVWKHPLISLGILIYFVGFLYDVMQEVFVIHTQTYIYSQVIPFGSIFTGTTYQFPLIWESSLVTTVMIPAGILCYRDDTGKTVAEKLAQRFRYFRRKPALGTFLVMFVIVNLAYLVLYGGSFALIRASHKATSVACPFPFVEAKTYDPQGFYEQNGQPGPYSEGLQAGWLSGQSGRPDVEPPADGGRCSPEKVR